MATEKEKTQPSAADVEGFNAMPKPTMLRRAASVGLSFINPFSDLGVIYRTGVKPLSEKFRILREQLADRSAYQESLDWTEAVQRTGRSAEQLLRTFRRVRTVWWVVMVVSGALSVMLFLMLLAANANLPLPTLIRAAITDLISASISLFSLVKVLNANVRLWQLSNRRVSIEEHGTFQDYRAENLMWLQIVMPKPKY